MLDVTVHGDRIAIGAHFSVSFQRTLRIPEDGRTHPLPPGLGDFPLRRVADYAGRVPAAWRTHGGVFMPMYQREAMWLSFAGAYWRPNAVKVAVGKVNAISGEPWGEALGAGTADYVVVPGQPWLDGVNAGDGTIRQFVAMPLGMGYTVEGQVTGEERFGGLQLICFDPKPGRFPDQAPPEPRQASRRATMTATAASAPAAEMGLAAGGRMRQRIHPDPHGVDTWDQANSGRVFVHIVNSEQWAAITGEPVPPTPVDAHAYTAAGLPWFELYDEAAGTVGRSDTLDHVKSVGEKDAEHGFSQQQDDSPLPGSTDVHGIPWPGGKQVPDGDW